MLSRYRSVSIVTSPGAYNNPVQRFEEAAEHRRWLLGERAAAAAAAPPPPPPGPEALFRTALRLWDGPLAGIAHQEGQFVALEEGPAGEAAPPPPDELAQGLSLDLELLLGLAELTRDVLYGAYGSESDFNVVPVILEPRLDAASTRPAGGPQPTPSIAQPPTTQLSDPYQPPSELLTLSLEQDRGCAGSGGGGGWWSLAEAVATPLTWEEVVASLEVSPGLAAAMQPPQRFDNKQAFWSHMLHKHISKLDGGDQEAAETAARTAEAPALAPAAPYDPWVTGPPPAAAAGGAGAAGGSGPTLQQVQQQQQPAGHGQFEDPEQRLQRQQQQRPTTAAAALAAAVQELSGVIAFPAALQVVLGSEALGWNPIPLLWMGRSRRSGAILGLLTAVVWT